MHDGSRYNRQSPGRRDRYGDDGGRWSDRRRDNWIEQDHRTGRRTNTGDDNAWQPHAVSRPRSRSRSRNRHRSRSRSRERLDPRRGSDWGDHGRRDTSIRGKPHGRSRSRSRDRAPSRSRSRSRSRGRYEQRWREGDLRPPQRPPAFSGPRDDRRTDGDRREGIRQHSPSRMSSRNGGTDWHERSSAQEVRAGARLMKCKFWEKGACKNGDRCRFAHTGTRNSSPERRADRPEELTAGSVADCVLKLLQTRQGKEFFEDEIPGLSKHHRDASVKFRVLGGLKGFCDKYSQWFEYVEADATGRQIGKMRLRQEKSVHSLSQARQQSTNQDDKRSASKTASKMGGPSHPPTPRSHSDVKMHAALQPKVPVAPVASASAASDPAGGGGAPAARGLHLLKANAALQPVESCRLDVWPELWQGRISGLRPRDAALWAGLDAGRSSAEVVLRLVWSGSMQLMQQVEGAIAGVSVSPTSKAELQALDEVPPADLEHALLAGQGSGSCVALCSVEEVARGTATWGEAQGGGETAGLHALVQARARDALVRVEWRAADQPAADTPHPREPQCTSPPAASEGSDAADSERPANGSLRAALVAEGAANGLHRRLLHGWRGLLVALWNAEDCG